ncbi:MAG: adenylate/guanylate cyclase domain-containing protein [Bauldia sp.]
MGEAGSNRRLAAILAADVVGYSRMMAGDEAGTLAALKRHREALFDPAVSAHNGRVFKLIGDGTLVEFGSVVDAVKCALAIQAAAAGQGGTGGAPIVLRIGINLGDVILEGDDVYGDGVNVAARLEPLAEPGGICVASIVNESVGNRIDVPFRDGGEVHVKNIDRPIRIWKWHPGKASDVGGTAPVAPSQGPAVASNDKPAKQTPSIAVLPFTNMSGDPEQEYFSDGISEDIITDLSKVGGLLVIARNSSFTYKGKNVDIRSVGRELGVRSVLEGSIRRAGNRVRITAQLIDAANGAHLWAERYDRDLTDIFAVQDEVTRHIVGALKVTLTPAEAALISGVQTRRLDAHEAYMRGRAIVFGSDKTRETFQEAVVHFTGSIALDPDYAEPYAGLSALYTFDYQNRWSDDPDRSLDEAGRLAATAIEKNPNDPLAHCVVALAAMFKRDLETGRVEADKALALNPNLAMAHNSRCVLHIYSGEPLAAIPFAERAMRLDPAYSQQYLHFLGLAYLLAGKYETASVVFKQRILLVPGTDLSRAFLASALGHLGEVDEARRVWREMMDINPRYAFEGHVGRLPFKHRADVDRIKEGLTKAGLPE